MSATNTNVEIAFSGGRTSGYMLWRLLQENGGSFPSTTKVIFSNTGREMPETLDFVQACSDHWNVDITWLEYTSDTKNKFIEVNYDTASRDGTPFKQLVKKRRYLPNVVTRFCTAELKINTSIRYLKHACKWSQWTKFLGIRYDESHRVKANTPKELCIRQYPLVDWQIRVTDIVDFWRKQNFGLELPNHNGKCWLGNCDGCFLKSEWSIAMLSKLYPERHQWWVEMEEELSNTLGKQANFKKNTSYKEIGEFVNKQGDWIFDEEQFGDGGILCQANDGECTG